MIGAPLIGHLRIGHLLPARPRAGHAGPGAPDAALPGIWASAAVLLLSACQPAETGWAEAQQQAALQAAEALKAQGARDASVQIQRDSFRAALTQGDGRSALVTVGAGSVGPADSGLPWYPGAQPDPGRSSKVSGADGQVASVVLTTPDAVERVADFYRQRLSAFPTGTAREGRSAEGWHTFVAADDGGQSATQVWVARATSGSEITLLTTRQAPR